MARTYNKGTLIIERTTAVGGLDNDGGFILRYDGSLSDANDQVDPSIADGGFYRGTFDTQGSQTLYVIQFKGLTVSQLMEAIESDPQIPNTRVYLNTAVLNATDRESINAQIAAGDKLSETLVDQMKTVADVKADLAGLDSLLFDSETSGVTVFTDGAWGTIRTSAWELPITEAPTVTVTAVTSDSITFEWTPAVGSPVLSHSYTYTGGDSNHQGEGITESPVTITGLTPETLYTITVVGLNNISVSPDGTATATTAIAAPEDPTITELQTGDESIAVLFTVSDTGNPATSIEYSVDSGSNWIAFSGTSSPQVITGLTNGQNYTPLIRATNSGGSSSNVGLVDLSHVTPNILATPNPNADAAYELADGIHLDQTDWTNAVGRSGYYNNLSWDQLRASWTERTYVEYSVDSGGTWLPVVLETDQNDDLLITVRGLEQNTQYTVSLRFTNATGTFGPASSGFTFTTAGAVPTAPADLVASYDSDTGALTVHSFTLPVSDNGSPITEYQMTGSHYGPSTTDWDLVGNGVPKTFTPSDPLTFPIVIDPWFQEYDSDTGAGDGAWVTQAVSLRAVNANGVGDFIGNVATFPMRIDQTLASSTETTSTYTISPYSKGSTLYFALIVDVQYSTDNGATWVNANHLSNPVPQHSDEIWERPVVLNVPSAKLRLIDENGISNPYNA